MICVSYDGFDETQTTVLISMVEETQKIEDYIRCFLNGKVDII